MDSMYEILMGLPFFRGVSYKRISDVIERTRFHFLKYAPGETIVEAGDASTHIRFVVSGSVRLTTVSADADFEVSQTLCAPDVIAPDFLFGKTTCYPCSAVALVPTGILQIEKREWVQILNSDAVFLFNFLNMLSMNAQKPVAGVLSLAADSVKKRIALWIVTLSQCSGKDIVLRGGRSGCVCELFGERDEVLSALETMKCDGLIDYSDREIAVLSRQGLLELLYGNGGEA